MFVTIIGPTGYIASLDLAAIPSWRLELTDLGMAGDSPSPEDVEFKRWLAVGFRYMAEGRSVFQAIAAIHMKGTHGELTQVAHVGLPRGNLVANKERLKESLKILHNCTGMTAKVADEYINKGAGLADVHHQVREALFGRETPIGSPGAVLRGEFEGWRYSISKNRFTGAVLEDATDVQGMLEAPAKQADNDVVGEPAGPPAPAPAKKSHRQPPTK